MSPNEPRRRGKAGAFEIWFLAVFDPAARRALWLRLTTLAPRGRRGARAIVWAAAFEDGTRPVAVKTIAPLEALAYGEGFDLRLGVVELREGFTAGEVRAAGRSIAWELRFDPAPAARRRRAIEALPLPVHAAHGAERASFSGWFAVDGERRPLGARAGGIQQHIWGERQPAEISWIFAPELDAETEGFAELASVRIGKRSPRATTLRLRGGGLDLAVADVPGVLRGRATTAGPALEIQARSKRRLVIARATAGLDDFVGYVYRDPTGGEVHVAQSDLARCEIEVHERRGLLLRPARRLRAPIAALEIHRPEPLEGVAYLGFDEAGPVAPHPKSAPPAPTRADQATLPRPSRILALGLTYADHLRETGTRAPKEPVVFEKPARTWLAEGAEVVIPGDAEMIAALEAVDPGISRTLGRRFGFLPAMMDYEVELGLMLLDPVRAGDLERARPRLGYFLANDLTARTCQVLGEGTADPFAFWAVAKGFTGFLPVGASLWVPPDASLDAWPNVALRLDVNGERRQDGSTRDLCYSPREMLGAAAKHLGGDLPEGLALITGTPAGVAMQLPAWKRRVADRLLDRFGKLGAAFDGYAKGSRFLRAGDVVRCDGGPLGARTVRLAFGPAG